MTPEQVNQIRNALGDAVGQHISFRDLGLMLGLAPANAADTVRSWEDGKKDVSGPASVALQLLGHAAGIGELPPEIGNMEINFRIVMRAIVQSMLGVAVTKPQFPNVEAIHARPTPAADGG